ncbi:MAG: response regulator transcription factor [Alistipes sp.]|jgi:two-component system alkaline phosphatase synthesis response regulator PhoP|nr:response regulator transcription factor [Alistipes sp.]MBQ1957917.1 response regulator transcription factor [Alistipes sp.]MBQ1980649.1 response regulator transcription factor [Alistipes sp.]MBQ2414924.1 response regulator transcription factor [Alistipes sp.]MBQ5785550.1 response regulator transcription factor [Alistipes sp.]
MAYRILLIDDEADILEFVKYNLEKDGYEVFTASNGAEGLEVALKVKPHLILLDMMMPVLDGIETCKAIRQSPTLKNVMVVFLSAVGTEETMVQGYGVGADDYINKPIKMNVLRGRVQAILKRITPVEISDKIEIDVEHYQVRKGEEVITLPRKEFSLLQLLHSQPGKLYTRDEIYAKVWGNKVVVGDRTIDVHIRKLRQKIGEDHIVTVKGMGYKFEE